MKNRTYTTLLASLLISGCAPIPHNEYFAPKISGVITINGTPVKNTKLYLGSEIKFSNCSSNPITTITNQKGEFEIGPIKEFKFFTMFYGDPAAIWELCAEKDGGKIKILYQNGHFSPSSLHVKCDLSINRTHVITNTNKGIFGKCQL